MIEVMREKERAMMEEKRKKRETRKRQREERREQNIQNYGGEREEERDMRREKKWRREIRIYLIKSGVSEIHFKKCGIYKNKFERVFILKI